MIKRCALFKKHVNTDNGTVDLYLVKGEIEGIPKVFLYSGTEAIYVFDTPREAIRVFHRIASDLTTPKQYVSRTVSMKWIAC